MSLAPLSLPPVAAVMAAVIALSGCARTDDAPPSAEAAGAEVRAALDTSVAAWNRGDLEEHVAIYADSAVFRPSGEGRGRLQARRVFAPFFSNPAARPQLALDSLTIAALGPDHVLASGQYVLTGGQVQVPRRGWFTEVWTRTSLGWRIVLDHSS